MIKLIKKITNQLETRFSTPTYSGWVLSGMSICFFSAATNTMAGWLYVLSGLSFAILGLAAVLPARSLIGVTVTRHPITPVTTGDDLTVEIEIHNQTKKAVNLIQVEDILPFVLGKPIKEPIEIITPIDSHRWTYHYPTQRRGIYRWHTVNLATGAPLGLFWSRREHQAIAKAVVYPQILPLNTCPLVDEMGQEDTQRGDPRGRPYDTSTEGLTRSLRPYRIGDPLRLIHWRSSARYGDLRVRELEKITGGEEVIIALDSAVKWNEENFEEAVIAASSLYFYAQKQQMQVQLWTALTGFVKGDRVALETLAGTIDGEDKAVGGNTPFHDHRPIIWLTENPLTISTLSQGSRWLLWQNQQIQEKATQQKEINQEIIVNQDFSGILVEKDKPLQIQLQQKLG
jgi:uncharacterized protein (DUF58 family)